MSVGFFWFLGFLGFFEIFWDLVAKFLEFLGLKKYQSVGSNDDSSQIYTLSLWFSMICCILLLISSQKVWERCTQVISSEVTK